MPLNTIFIELLYLSPYFFRLLNCIFIELLYLSPYFFRFEALYVRLLKSQAFCGTSFSGNIETPRKKLCNGKQRTVNKMIHYKLNYDSQLQRVSLTWWSDIFTKKYYKGPFQPESGASESDSIDAGFFGL